MKKSYLVLLLISILGLSSCGGNDDKNKIEASGTIEATNVTISSKIGGEIIDKLFREGDKVSSGDTLFIIDSEALQLHRVQLEAAKMLAEAQLELARKGARSEDVAQAEAAFKQAKINLEQAEKDKLRMQNLYESKSITQKQHEDFIAGYDLMKAQFNAANENLKKVKNITRPEELKQAEARLKQAIANLDLVKKNIRDCYINSPLNGFIVKKYFEKGETVSPMSSLVKIADLSVVNIIIYVSEVDLGKVKLGQKADIFTDTYDKVYPGKVVYISPESEFTPKNIQTKDERTKLVYAVKIEIPNESFELKSGMPADAVIQLKQSD